MLIFNKDAKTILETENFLPKVKTRQGYSFFPVSVKIYLSFFLPKLTKICMEMQWAQNSKNKLESEQSWKTS
jgi:hypothetical protein